MLTALLDKSGTLERSTIAKEAAGGTTTTYSTHATGKVSVWSKGAAKNMGFSRPDMLGTHVIASDQTYGARPGDRWYVGSDYYLIESVETFSNAAVSGETLILHNCTLRTI